MQRLIRQSFAAAAVMPDGKAPHFPQQPVARQNDDGSLELECFLEASPLPDIKWFYDTVRYSFILIIPYCKKSAQVPDPST